MKNQKGFTLIELLLVLAIIGIISAIAVPALLGQRESARQKSTVAAANAIKAEIANTAEGIRKSGVTPTADLVETALTAMPQYGPNVAKNPYFPGEGAYNFTAASAKNGQVGVVGSTTTGPDGSSYDCIAVSFQHVASGGTITIAVGIDN